MQVDANGAYARLRTVPGGQVVSLNLGGQPMLGLTANWDGRKVFWCLEPGEAQWTFVEGVADDAAFVFAENSVSIVVRPTVQQIDFRREAAAGDVLIGEDGTSVLVMKARNFRKVYVDLTTFEVTNSHAAQSTVVRDWSIIQTRRDEETVLFANLSKPPLPAKSV